jgi:hypothetical protein
MSAEQRCPNCGEPLASTALGENCSRCGAIIVDKQAHPDLIDDDHEMEIENEKVVVPPERY